MHVYSVEKGDIRKRKPEIIAIVGRNLPRSVEENFAWKYEEPPHGTARCWLIKNRDSENFVGSASIFPRKFYVNGKPMNAFVAGDFSVDAGHRSFGPALKLQREIIGYVDESEPESLVYGLPNRLSIPIFKRAGYRCVGHYGRYVKLLRAEYVVSRKNPVLRGLVKSINPMLKCVSRDFLYRRPDGVSVEVLEAFDKRFDALFKKILGQHAIVSDRTSEYLNWRYVKPPSRKSLIFSASRNKELIGYVVYYVRDNSCYMKDIICDDSNGNLDELFSEFIRYARKDNVETLNLYYFGSKAYKNMLKKHGFHLRQHEADNLFVHTGDREMEKIMSQEDNWHFLSGDND